MKYYIPILLSLTSLIVLPLATFSQVALGIRTQLEPGSLKRDLIALQDTLQRVHPGLYRYRDKQSIDRLFVHTIGQVDRPMTIIDYYSLVSQMISGIQDGHTECSLPDDIVNEIIGTIKIFPIQLRFIGKQAYVPCDTKPFSAGTEILSIDGKSMDRIRQELFTHLSSDGSIQTGKYVKINDGHDPFSYLYLVTYGYTPEFTVDYKNRQGRGVKQLPAALFPQMDCPPAEEAVRQYLTLDYKSAHTALLTIKTFADERLQKTKEDYKTFLASSFQAINDKKVKRLIIDLRENNGGEDGNGELLYAYLTNRPFAYYTSVGSIRENFKTEGHPNLGIQQPHENNFSGEVHFLISGKTYSSAAEFCSVAKSNARGKFIGEETGGGYYGNTSGARTSFVLPTTRIRVNIPLNKYVTAVKKTKYADRGIIPDYRLVPSITDRLLHKDVQLVYTLKLIENKK